MSIADDVAARDSLVDSLAEMAAHDVDRERRSRELALDNLRLIVVRNLESWRTYRNPTDSELDTASFLADVLCRVCAKFGNRN